MGKTRITGKQRAARKRNIKVAQASRKKGGTGAGGIKVKKKRDVKDMKKMIGKRKSAARKKFGPLGRPKIGQNTRRKK